MKKKAKILDANGNPVKPVVRRRPPEPCAEYYDAIYHSRLRQRRPFHVTDWMQGERGVREILISQSRDLHKNSPDVRALVNSVVKYSLGDGLSLQCECPNSEVSDDIDEYWGRWIRAVDCDSSASFSMMQSLIMTRMLVDGDVGIAFVEDIYGNPKLQIIESHRIKNPEGDHPNIVDGVRMDETGCPMGYYVQANRPELGEGKAKFRYIDSEHMMLLFDAERTPQLRGMPSYASEINDCFDLQELKTFAVAGTKIREGIALVVTNESGVASSDDDPGFTIRGEQVPPTVLGGRNTKPYAFDITTPGYAPRLKPNEKVEDLKVERPGASFHMLVSQIRRALASSVGVPVEVVWSEMAGSAPTLRARQQLAQRQFDYYAGLMEGVCDRIYRWVIGDAITKGILAPAYGWKKTYWQRRRHFSIDKGRDTKADLMDLQSGATTMKNIADKRGHNWKDILKQRMVEAEDILAKAKAFSKERNITMAMALSMLTNIKQITEKGSVVVNGATGFGSGISGDFMEL